MPYFPLYEYRQQERRIHDLSFEEQQNLPAGSNHVDVVDRRPDAESTEAVLPDTRGQGGYTKEGRYIRPYKGSTRPPHVDPVVWEGIYTAKDKEQCIKEYLDSLRVASAPIESERTGAPAAPAVPERPRKSHFHTKYVCFAKGECKLIEEFVAVDYWPGGASSPKRYYYTEKDIEGVATVDHAASWDIVRQLGRVGGEAAKTPTSAVWRPVELGGPTAAGRRSGALPFGDLAYRGGRPWNATMRMLQVSPKAHLVVLIALSLRWLPLAVAQPLIGEYYES